MPKFRRSDVLRGALVGAILVIAWPVVSRVWLAFLKPLALWAAGDRSASGPTGASLVLPLALAVLVAWPLPRGIKTRSAGLMLCVTMGGELLLVLLGTALHLSPPVMTVIAGVVQNVAPVSVLLGAVTSRRVS